MSGLRKGDGRMLKYENATSNISIVFAREILGEFERHRQLTTTDPEAGGQLFARFEDDVAYVEKVTGPRPTDLRTRFGFRPDRRAEQKEIETMFKHGLHYVGDWHTHPEQIPMPSPEDFSSIRAAVTKSKHELKGFLLVVVGNAPFPTGLYVSLHSGRESHVLRAAGLLLPVLTRENS